MNVFAIGAILLIASALTFAALNSIVMGLRGIRNWRTSILLPAGVLALLGVGGFFGAALSSVGGLDWLGSFEWPIGHTSGVVRLPDGRYVVPHTPSGRVQVYDRALRFQRGWRISASGGMFVVRTSPDWKIHIDTARGDRHLVYDPDGRLLLEGDVRDGGIARTTDGAARRVDADHPDAVVEEAAHRAILRVGLLHGGARAMGPARPAYPPADAEVEDARRRRRSG